MPDQASIKPEPDTPLVYHVYPTADEREHVTRGTACWCGPHFYRLCSQCDHEPDCWACKGSGVIRIDEIVPGARAMVVHHLVSDDAEFSYIETPE